MKATIIGTDLLEQNGEVKILEINTNTTIYNEGADFLDYSGLFAMLVSNNISEFHFIWTEIDSFKPLNQPFRFKRIIQEKCEENNITYYDYTVPAGSVTVPFIEDSPSKFILRQAFDTTALLDETYCADKFEFVNLMNGTDYLPKTFVPGTSLGMDTLSSVDFSVTTNPNLIVKKKSPQYDVSEYPALHTADSSQYLQDLKNEASQQGNEFVQEFVFSEENLANGKYAIIRSIDIVYGSTLDVIHMGGYKQSTIIPITFYPDEFLPDTRELNKKSRYKYITKELGGAINDYHTDEDSDILMYNGTLSNVDAIQLGDLIRSIDFEDNHGNHAASFDKEKLETYGWVGTLEKSNETLSQMSTALEDKRATTVDTVYIRITLSDGRSWVDSPSCVYYIEEVGSTATRFEKLNKMYVGDKLVITDSNTSSLSTIEITNLEMEYAQKVIYTLDFEPGDLFLVDIGDGGFSVMHNSCWCPWSYCGNYCRSSYCSGCGGGFYFKF